MRFKKNGGAKTAALLASLAALGGIWALVHQNPPASAGASTTTTATAPATTPPPRGNAGVTSQPNAPVAKKHTRTRAS